MYVFALGNPQSRQPRLRKPLINFSGCHFRIGIEQDQALWPRCGPEPTKNVTVNATTSEGGDFVFTALQPGTYTVSVTAQGFKKLDRPNMVLNANDKLALGTLSLEVGSITESVEVTAPVTLLQTDSIELGDDQQPPDAKHRGQRAKSFGSD